MEVKLNKNSATPSGLRPVGCLNPQVSLRLTCGYYSATPSGSSPGSCELQLVDLNKKKHNKSIPSGLKLNPITQRFINNSQKINPMIQQNPLTNNPTPTGCNNNSHRLSWRNLWDKTKPNPNPEGVAQE
jgi:hypothetical protein